MSSSLAVASRVKDYSQLMKFNLTFMVAFSSVVGYWLAAPKGEFSVIKVLLLFAAGILVTGAANTINQLLERDTDKLMARTSVRPLPTGRVSVQEATVLATVASIGGLLIMGCCFNWLSAGISSVSLIMYGFIYTPWKKWNSLAVLVGAFPGALPPLIGWTAGANAISEGGISLFVIQFIWQFPHFWAIAWLGYKDYEKAGFRLLPSSGGPTRLTALQATMWVLLLFPAGLAPYLLKLCGPYYAGISVAAALYFLYRAIQLLRKCDVPTARKLMFGSYVYLTVTQLAMLADKV
ncbi:heme o synthase [Chitinophaga costaii]|uniref:heme o synthase n=1 Tax=Chitinophaga costaii TaxID=1335309 RepID=UPI002014E00E|nr:heme o synthase [Chitinophaga costaii]